MAKENQRVVLVTGASSGIGLACATHLAEKGFRVYGTSRRPETALRNGVNMLPADVTDKHAIENAVTTVLEREQRIDILVNNAGVAVAGAVEDTSIEQATYQFDVNFFGAVR